MGRKDGFIGWLEKNIEVKEYTRKRYVNAIKTVSEDLTKLEVFEGDLFEISDPSYIDHILMIPSFKQKDKKGNRMYSTALKANIFSLCLVCHKKLHYGIFEDKKVILFKLYNKRKNRLEQSGIYIDIDELYNLYQV